MKSKLLLVGLLALGMSSLAAYACHLQITIACPDGTPGSGIKVCVLDTPAGDLCAETDEFGVANIVVENPGTYQVCVDPSTLPKKASLAELCQEIVVVSDQTPFLELSFTLGGDFCSIPPPPGPCWLTGGGTIDKTKGVPHYSFGGVVYPGCSPKAAEGGNWNVIDHFAGLHFQGQQIIVDSCSGVSTKSPKVDVNVIDFHGFGIVSGISGNPLETVAVTFVGRAVDNLEPGAGKDLLYLSVSGGLLQIGSLNAPVLISTGNLQIHTTGCNK